MRACARRCAPRCCRRLSTSAGHQTASTSTDDGAWITKVGAAVNGAATLTKGVAGWAAGSPSLVADAGHSLSDLLSDACTLWALDQARKPASSSHPYGRGKYEAVGASFTAASIVCTGLGIGFNAVSNLYDVILIGPPPIDTSTLGVAAGAAVAGVLAKELLYRETLRIGLELRSPALLANAWHHRTDAWSSLVALAGIGGSVCGLPVLDSIGGVVVAAMVTRVGLQMGMENFAQLTDASVEDDILQQIAELVARDPDVISTSSLRCRRLGPSLHVDTRLQVPFELTVSAAQQVATKAKLRVLEAMPEVAEVTVSLDAEAPAAPVEFGTGIVVGRKINPRLGELMRSPAKIEEDVRRAISKSKHGALWGLSHTLVHWRSRDACSGAIVEANLVIDPSVTVREAHALACELREEVMRSVPGLLDVDLHMELFDGAASSPMRYGIITSPNDESLPTQFRLNSGEDSNGMRTTGRVRDAQR